MKTLVIGAGAIGSIVAGILTLKGFDIDLVCQSTEQSEKLNIDGLVFKIKNRKHIQLVPSYPSVNSTPGNYSYVILATKTFDMTQPAKEAIQKLSPKGDRKSVV